MDPKMKSGIDALSADLDAAAQPYKAHLEQPVEGIPGGLQGTRDSLPGFTMPGIENFSDQIGAMLDPATFSETTREIAGSIVPKFVEGVTDGFMGQWGFFIIVIFIMQVARLIYVSFLGDIDYKGVFSLGNPGGLKLLVFAVGLFGLAGYAGYQNKSPEDTNNAPSSHLTSQNSYFRK